METPVVSKLLTVEDVFDMSGVSNWTAWDGKQKALVSW